MLTITHREFLKGAAAFGSFLGGRIFAAPIGWKHEGEPNLVFGILADTHLNTSRDGKPVFSPWKLKDNRWTGDPLRFLTSALKYFRAQNVDAIMHCGDFAERGQVSEIRFHADVWRKVFPNDLAPDGHRVARLFVTGNHDLDGLQRGKSLNPDYAVRVRNAFQSDIAGNWERIWDEPYEPVWHKEVKGYHFFGQNWEEVDGGKLAPLVNDGRETYGLDNQSKPFFLVSHAPCKTLNEALRPYRNSVGFFGHYHESAASWNVIRFYTSSQPWIECPTCSLFGANWLLRGKLPRDVSGEESKGVGRQGYVVRVYDDMLVIERHEFWEGGKIGADWVMPLGKVPHPFSKGELLKVIGEPQFRKGAKLEVSLDRIDKINKIGKTANDNPVNPVNLVQENPASPKLCVRIPLADGNPDSRVYAYEVVVVGDEGNPKLRKAIYAAGCNLAVGTEPNVGVTTLEIAKDELPPGKSLTVAARPLTSLGTSGRPIITDFKV